MARHALEVARNLEAQAYPADSASKSYYAMFYAAQALLTAEGIHATKHSTVEAALGLHFAKTGRLDPKFHRLFIDGRKLRHLADYSTQVTIEDLTASEALDAAAAFVAAVQELLSAPRDGISPGANSERMD
jgi:uncharacterized protein (UPF0332 family)